MFLLGWSSFEIELFPVAGAHPFSRDFEEGATLARDVQDAIDELGALLENFYETVLDRIGAVIELPMPAANKALAI